MFNDLKILFIPLLDGKNIPPSKNSGAYRDDSAYNMESYLLVPFDKVNVKTPTGQKEDAYNLYHSNCRIAIECTFGELVMRWGIFWRKLQVNLGAVGGVVSACGLLHNYIVDHQLKDDQDNIEYFSSFSHSTLHSGDSGAAADDCPIVSVTGTDQPKPRGRPSSEDKLSKEQGLLLRRTHCY
jgi:hypothetical protein